MSNTTLDAVSTGGWIKVTKSRPPQKKLLLLLMSDGKLKIGYWIDRKDGEGLRWWECDTPVLNLNVKANAFTMLDPTHWMEIPVMKS